MTIINENGKTIVIKDGGSVSISNGVVKVNGQVITDTNSLEEKHIYLIFEGSVDQVTVDSCEEIEIKGDAGNVNTHNGNVTVSQNVSNNVSTHNGNVMCGSVGGNVSSHNGNIMHK